MLPLKRNSESAAPQMPLWHPNFRNYETLPDIKKVRTVFFVNVGAITTAIVFLGIVGYQEYKLLNINKQISETEATIARDKKVSDVALKLFTQYSTEEKKLQEIDAFLKARPTLSQVLIQFARTLPNNIAFTLFDLKGGTLTLRGIVRGAPELASGTANAYVEQLRKDKDMTAVFDDVSLTNLSRDPGSGRLIVELSLKLKSDKPEKK